MAFTNRPIPEGSLPELDDEAFELVESGYLRQQQTMWAIVCTVLAAIVSGFVLVAGGPRWLVLAAIVGAAVIIVTAVALERAAFRHRGMLLREHDITSRRGLISRTTSTAPFVRVQHVTVERGPLDRVFGLARLKVFTAGAGFADLVIAGLSPDKAQQLREVVLSRSAAATAPTTVASMPAPAVGGDFSRLSAGSLYPTEPPRAP